jgi:acetyltransferase-like isoleucine patch superfamily enzyme
MISGMQYNCWAPELNESRITRHERARQYGSIFLKDFRTTEEFMNYRRDFLGTIFGKLRGENIYMEPFSVDYGFNTEIGDNFYSNFNLTILDCSIVKIGSGVMIGPNVTICCATHHLDPVERVDNNNEYAREITIGDKVWIGANVAILQGAVIGDGVTIGANSVVTAGTVIPPYTVAVGSPCRVVKKLPGYNHEE